MIKIILMVICIYGVFAFIETDLNAYNWHMATRVIFVITAITFKNIRVWKIK